MSILFRVTSSCFVLVLLLQVAVARDFGYGKQDILEFKNNTSHLVLRDINGDGLDDVLFLNNHASRVEILIAAKEGFKNRGFVMDQWSRSFRVADMNNDGKEDLVFVGNHLGLQVYLQSENVAFAPPQNFHFDEPAKLIDLEVEDLDGDGFAEVLLCRQDRIDIVKNVGDSLTIASALQFGAGKSCKGVLPMDIDGDNDVDLTLLFANTEYPLQVRRNRGDGSFGWSQFLNTPPLRSLRQVPLGAKEILGVVLKNSQVVRLYDIQTRHTGFDIQKNISNPLRVPLMGMDETEGLSYAITAKGLLLNSPDLNQLQLYAPDKNQVVAKPLFINTLKGVGQLSHLDTNRVAVLSVTEKAVAIHDLDTPEVFPRFLDDEGEPLAIDSRRGRLFTLVLEEGVYSLVQYSGELKVQSRITLDLDNAPQGIMVVPLSDWGVGLMVFRPYERPLFYRLKGDKAELIASSAFRALSQNLRRSDISLAEDGSLLVCEGPLVRRYRFDGAGFKVVRQFNPQRAQAQLRAPLLRGERLLVWDENKNDLLVFDVASEHFHSLKLRGDAAGLQTITTLGDDTILLSDKEMLLLPTRAQLAELEMIAEYSSKQSDPGLWNLFAVDLGRVQNSGLAVLDYKNRSVELLRYSANKLELGVAFEVFQDAGFSESKNSYEPRFVASGDCNGDGIADLVFLVHNKLLIHYGE